MSQISGYPKAAFGPNAWLLGYSNSNSQTTLFTAQSVIDYFNLEGINEELLVRVRSFTTNQDAITVDMPLNTILYTAGNTAVSDGGGGHWIVVETGGSVNMNNGYQMKLLPVGDLAGSDATLTVVDSDTGSAQTLQDALNDRSTDFDGLTEIDVSGNTNILLTSDQARNSTIRFFGATTGDISVSTPTNDPKTYLVINNDTGGNTITFKTSTGTGVGFSQEGDEREVRSDGTNMVNICRHALGETVAVPNGGIIPPIENYVILSDSTDDTASYNSGKVDNEQTTGSGATVVISFDIADTSSPFDNETWNCWNSEVRNPSAGATPGTLSNDEGQQITGQVGPSLLAGNNSLGIAETGALGFTISANNARTAGAGSNSIDSIEFDSSLSTDSRQDSDRFHYKREEVTYYRRFK